MDKCENRQDRFSEKSSAFFFSTESEHKGMFYRKSYHWRKDRRERWILKYRRGIYTKNNYCCCQEVISRKGRRVGVWCVCVCVVSGFLFYSSSPPSLPWPGAPLDSGLRRPETIASIRSNMDAASIAVLMVWVLTNIGSHKSS